MRNIDETIEIMNEFNALVIEYRPLAEAILLELRSDYRSSYLFDGDAEVAAVRMADVHIMENHGRPMSQIMRATI